MLDFVENEKQGVRTFCSRSLQEQQAAANDAPLDGAAFIQREIHPAVITKQQQNPFEAALRHRRFFDSPSGNPGFFESYSRGRLYVVEDLFEELRSRERLAQVINGTHFQGRIPSFFRQPTGHQDNGNRTPSGVLFQVATDCESVGVWQINIG